MALGLDTKSCQFWKERVTTESDANTAPIQLQQRHVARALLEGDISLGNANPYDYLDRSSATFADTIRRYRTETFEACNRHHRNKSRSYIDVELSSVSGVGSTINPSRVNAQKVEDLKQTIVKEIHRRNQAEKQLQALMDGLHEDRGCRTGCESASEWSVCSSRPQDAATTRPTTSRSVDSKASASSGLVRRVKREVGSHKRTEGKRAGAAASSMLSAPQTPHTPHSSRSSRVVSQRLGSRNQPAMRVHPGPR
eukprot:Rmarinus@m.4231